MEKYNEKRVEINKTNHKYDKSWMMWNHVESADNIAGFFSNSWCVYIEHDWRTGMCSNSFRRFHASNMSHQLLHVIVEGRADESVDWSQRLWVRTAEDRLGGTLAEGGCHAGGFTTNKKKGCCWVGKTHKSSITCSDAFLFLFDHYKICLILGPIKRLNCQLRPSEKRSF